MGSFGRSSGFDSKSVPDGMGENERKVLLRSYSCLGWDLDSERERVAEDVPVGRRGLLMGARAE